MNAEVTTIISCECCGSAHNESIATKRGWNLRRCNDCACIFVWPQPRPEALKDIYNKSDGYFKTAETDLGTTSPYAAVELNNKIREIRPSSKSIFDVGCASGKTLYHLRKMGWTVSGCDLNSRALRIAKANGLEVYEGCVETSPHPPHAFDVINMGDVIEHVVSPSKVVAAVHNLLKPGGLLTIRTPNSQCSFATSTLYLSRVTKFPWPHSEAPYHLFEFSPKGVRALLERNGFDIVAFTTSRTPSFRYTVGATGFFDGLKAKLKGHTGYKIRAAAIAYLPVLTAISAMLLPFHLYALVMDPIRSSGNAMNVIARSRIK